MQKNREQNSDEKEAGNKEKGKETPQKNFGVAVLEPRRTSNQKSWRKNAITARLSTQGKGKGELKHMQKICKGKN